MRKSRRCDNCRKDYYTIYRPGLVGLFFLMGLLTIGYAFVGLVFWWAGLLYWSQRHTKCTWCGARDGEIEDKPAYPQVLEPIAGQES